MNIKKQKSETIKTRRINKENVGLNGNILNSNPINKIKVSLFKSIPQPATCQNSSCNYDNLSSEFISVLSRKSVTQFEPSPELVASEERKISIRNFDNKSNMRTQQYLDVKIKHQKFKPGEKFAMQIPQQEEDLHTFNPYYEILMN